MMSSGGFLKLLLVFPVVGFINLYSCQATAQQTMRSPSILFTNHRQQQQKQWESPITMPYMNHSAPSNSHFIDTAVPFPISLQGQVMNTAFLHQPLITDRVADSISYSVLRFGLEVGSQLSENAYYSKSEIFSPLSVLTALSLLLVGAKGKSYQQLKPIFGFDLNTELQRSPYYAQLFHNEFGILLKDLEQNDIKALHHSGNAKWRDTPVTYNIRGSPSKKHETADHVIKVANGLFTQLGYNLNLNYKDVITSLYRSELSQLDFHTNGEAARQHINAWVSKNTYGRIPNIITNAIPQSTNMILASVLYFKGFWENTFFEAATSLDNFFPEGENKPPIKVQMMVTGGVFPYYDTNDYRIIGLPYKGNLSTMYVIQPMHSSRSNLKTFQSKITAELIEDMISKMAYRSAIVAFPKMHIERQLNMKEILRHFGVTDIFSSSLSDLSLIGGAASETIKNIYQSLPITSALPIQTVQPNLQPQLMDRFNEAPLFFSSRFGEIGNELKLNKTTQNDTTDVKTNNDTTSKGSKEDLELNSRKKRETLINTNPINLLETERLATSYVKSDLYVQDILHKVDFEVNEHGTEAAAATLTYLRRSGTDVIFRAETPFILLIRHDPSKLILFYGIVNEPES